MTTPSAWRFQWPDGTWIRWNPETEEWEKEPGTPGEAPADVTDSGTRARGTTISRASATPTAFLVPDEPEKEPDGPRLEDEVVDDRDTDDEGSRTRARPATAVFAGGPYDEKPQRLTPTIIGGAAIGVVVGIVITVLLR